jgi:hypothetical protein
MRVRFVMVGGFLGAGKTTTVARLASMYMRRGQRVGIVTNDQAAALVDTRNLETRGLAVAEVAGACFCCRFETLTEQIGHLSERARPDVIIAEPVGSCTDLVATVIEPLRRFYPSAIDVAPFLVVLKPSLARLVLVAQQADTTGDVGYIFRKQLEEAELILVNHSDALPSAVIDNLQGLVARHYPGATSVIGSARTGQGFDALLDLLELDAAPAPIRDLDYDRYAAGEAELGWLNASLRVIAPRSFAIDSALIDVLENLRRALVEERADVAHVKIMGLTGAACGVANWIGAGADPELSRPSGIESQDVELIVNARVLMDPAALQAAVRGSIDLVASRHGAETRDWKASAFRPGRPVPTHRFSALS